LPINKLLCRHPGPPSSGEASERLLRLGEVAATPMRDWGERNQYIRIAFRNEPIARLTGLRDRGLRALEDGRPS
jgi:aspartate/methionine/tyrosine aminotransferase